MANAKSDSEPGVHVVRESFVIDVNGSPVAYRKGEPIEADDPILKRLPQHFEPMVFPHPVGRKNGSAFAAKMAEAKAAKKLEAPSVEDAIATAEVKAG